MSTSRRTTMTTIGLAGLLATTGALATPVAASAEEPTAPYLVGAGIHDITGAVAETGAFGYAAQQEMDGLRGRLYSHAHIVKETATGRSVVLVGIDEAAVFQAVRLPVLKRLEAEFGGRYDASNVLISATHTHAANSGLTWSPLYHLAGNDKAGYGYSAQNPEAVVSGIVASIRKADAHLEPGTVSFQQAELPGVTRNRSMAAHVASPDAKDRPSTNQTMQQLELIAADGRPVGLVNWFAIHPTSLSQKNTRISGDSKGLAQYLTEQAMGSNPTDERPFVASFVNAEMGDVVPVAGNADSAPGYRGSSDELANVKAAALPQFELSQRLWHRDGQPVSGAVDARHRWVQMPGYRVRDEFTGAGDQQLCSSARGFSFAAGGENGPSRIPGIQEGMTVENTNTQRSRELVDQSALGRMVRATFGILPLGVPDPCQAEKPPVLSDGVLGWTDQLLPVQLVRLGNVAIIALPAEATTTTGQRLREAVAKELAASGVEHVVLSGPANDYAGYVATREEYAAQHYEGASTEWGPWQQAAFSQEFVELARALRDGTRVTDDAQPRDRSGQHFTSRPGVVLDDKPAGQQFGDVLQQPVQAARRGTSVQAVFRAGHPKNDLRTMDSYLRVQQLVDGQWRTVRTDRDWDTSYSWKREGASFSRATVEWEIGDDVAPGTYRLQQLGSWKNGWNGAVTSYEGTSRAFEVR